MRVVPLTGGPRPSSEVLRDWLADGGTVLPAGRPGPRRGGRPGHLLRATRRRCPAGRRCSPRRPGPRSSRSSAPFTGDGLAARRSTRRCPSRCPAGCGTGSATAMQAVADAFAAGIAEQPEDWHMLGADLDRRRRPTRRGRRAGGSRPDAHRPGLPVPVGRPRRRPVPRAGPRRDAARDGAPRRGARPGRARGVAARRARHLRRAHRAGALQRLDGEHAVRPGLGGPGAPLAARRPLRRRPRARAGVAVGLAAGLHDRQGPDRGDLPRRHHPVEVAGRRRTRWRGRGWRRSAAGSRCRTSPAACRSSTSAATR